MDNATRIARARQTSSSSSSSVSSTSSSPSVSISPIGRIRTPSAASSTRPSSTSSTPTIAARRQVDQVKHPWQLMCVLADPADLTGSKDGSAYSRRDPFAKDQQCPLWTGRKGTRSPYPTPGRKNLDRV